ncbi:MAG: peptide deformylase, partial [Pseudomonadota bacterium]
VVDISDGEDPDAPRTILKMANPEVLWSSDERRSYEEGCLSLPDQFAPVVRPERIKVQYLDYDGDAQEIEADGLLATCIQHEIDHLDGILFVDHISSIKRDIILRKLKKMKKQAA